MKVRKFCIADFHSNSRRKNARTKRAQKKADGRNGETERSGSLERQGKDVMGECIVFHY